MSSRLILIFRGCTQLYCQYGIKCKQQLKTSTWVLLLGRKTKARQHDRLGSIVLVYLQSILLCTVVCDSLKVLTLCTLISLINMTSRLLILKNSTLHKKTPPYTFIDFLDFFHPPRLFQ